MATTYRSPTPEETQTYTDKLADELLGLSGPALRVAKTESILEEVFGPCTFERLGNKYLVTQLTLNSAGEQVQFTLDSDLDG